MSEKGIVQRGRPGQLTGLNTSPDLFPFDAFEFTDPSRTANPKLYMKEPWGLQVPTLDVGGNITGPRVDGFKVIPDGVEATELLSELTSYTAVRGAPTTKIRSLVRWADIDPVESFPIADSNVIQRYDSTGLPDGTEGYYVYNVEFQEGDGGSTPMTNWTAIVNSGGVWNWASKATILADGTATVYETDPSMFAFTVYEYKCFTYIPTFNLLGIKSGGDNGSFDYTFDFRFGSGLSERVHSFLLYKQTLSDQEVVDIIGTARGFKFSSLTSGTGNVKISENGFYWEGDSGKSITLGDEAVFDGVTVRSENYVAGTSGWEIDTNGDVEFNEGTFRGDLEVGSDVASRQIFIGSQGIRAEDVNDNILHDLPNAALLTGYENIGHLFYNTDATAINRFDSLASGMPASGVWTPFTILSGNNTNAKGVLLQIAGNWSGSTSTSSVVARVAVRPAGSGWVLPNPGGAPLPISGVAPTLGAQGTGGAGTWGTLTVSTKLSTNMEFYVSYSGTGPFISLQIAQLGIYV
jgi:hypothetical protein